MGFVINPVGFLISTIKDFPLGLNPEKFLEFKIFPVELSSSHRHTETGCIYKQYPENPAF